MLLGILENTPLWVWPLGLLLFAVGVRASRARAVPVWLIYGLPALGVLALNAVAGLPAAGWVWGVFALAYFAGCVFGFRFQRRVLTRKSAGRAHLAGEWVTLIVLMVIFWMNFLAGMTAEVAPEFYGSGGFHGVFAVVAGLASGSFLGRALRVWQAVDGAQNPG